MITIKILMIVLVILAFCAMIEGLFGKVKPNAFIIYIGIVTTVTACVGILVQ